MKLKKGFIIILVTLLLLICFTLFGAIDIARFYDEKTPLFIIKKDHLNDGGTTVYYGIGYQLISWRQISDDNPGDFVGKECHILFYRDISDGPSAGVPLVFEEWNKENNHELIPGLTKEIEASGSDKMNAQTETENTESSISDTEQLTDAEREGGQMGFISGFLESDGKQLVFDCAEWIVDMSEPNGFRIENQEKEELTYVVDENTEYGIMSRVGASDLIKVDKNTFMERLEEYESLGVLNISPFIIKEQNGIIRVIYERYVP